MAKYAVLGLRGIALMPVTKNDITGYTSGPTAFAMPYAGAMNKTPKTKKQDIYYDDTLYATFEDFLGEDVEVRFGEVDPATLEDLGMGVYDPETELFEGEFSVKPGEYSLRAITDTVDKLPFYWNYRLFRLTGIRFDNFKTNGDGVTVCEIIMTGTMLSPAMPSVYDYAYMRLKPDASNQTACDAFLTAAETFPKP